MITVRFLGNRLSKHGHYEVLRDSQVVGCVIVPYATAWDRLASVERAEAIARRDFI
jgi:hypothetical protein